MKNKNGYESIKIIFNPVKALNFLFISCGVALLIAMLVLPFFIPFLDEYRTQELHLIKKYRNGSGKYMLIMEEEISGLNYTEYGVSASKYNKAEIGDEFILEDSLFGMNAGLFILMTMDIILLCIGAVALVMFGINYIYSEADKDFSIEIDRFKPIRIQKILGK